MYIYIYIQICIYICKCIYIYIHTYIYINMHTHGREEEVRPQEVLPLPRELPRELSSKSFRSRRSFIANPLWTP